MKPSTNEELQTLSKEELCQRIISNEKLIELLELRDKIIMAELEKKAYLVEKYSIPELPQYSDNWTWSTKIVYALKESGTPLRMTQIVNSVVQNDNKIYNRYRAEKKISNSLTNSTESGRLLAIKIAGIRGRFYALPEWMDSEGKLLPDFKARLDIWV